MSGTISKSSLAVLKVGSLVRVTLPMYDGKLALGTVNQIQIIYSAAQIHTLIWVEMILEGRNRPFEPENLEIVKRFNNGFDNAFIADLVTEKAA